MFPSKIIFFHFWFRFLEAAMGGRNGLHLTSSMAEKSGTKILLQIFWRSKYVENSADLEEHKGSTILSNVQKVESNPAIKQKIA